MTRNELTRIILESNAESVLIDREVEEFIEVKGIDYYVDNIMQAIDSYVAAEIERAIEVTPDMIADAESYTKVHHCSWMAKTENVMMAEYLTTKLRERANTKGEQNADHN